MTNEQILKKAIEKASKNVTKGLASELVNYGFEIYWMAYMKKVKDIPEGYYAIIFSHDFAKAFWGEKDYRTETVGELDARRNHNKLCWEYHLQKMVLTKEPLRYLEKFL